MAISEDSIAITHFVDLKEASTKILKIIIVKIIKGGGKKPLRKYFSFVLNINIKRIFSKKKQFSLKQNIKKTTHYNYSYN